MGAGSICKRVPKTAEELIAFVNNPKSDPKLVASLKRKVKNPKTGAISEEKARAFLRECEALTPSGDLGKNWGQEVLRLLDNNPPPQIGLLQLDMDPNKFTPLTAGITLFTWESPQPSPPPVAFYGERKTPDPITPEARWDRAMRKKVKDEYQLTLDGLSLSEMNPWKGRLVLSIEVQDGRVVKVTVGKDTTNYPGTTRRFVQEIHTVATARKGLLLGDPDLNGTFRKGYQFTPKEVSSSPLE